MLLFKCFQALTDEAIQRLAQNCLNIHYLCISGCPNLTDATLLALAQYCHKLTTFEAAGCSQFTDNGFQALARVNYLFNTIRLQTMYCMSNNNLFFGCISKELPLFGKNGLGGLRTYNR